MTIGLHALARIFTRAILNARKPGDANANRRVRVPVIDSERLVRAAFAQIARDGAGSVEVAERLQQSLSAILSVATGGFAAACRLHSRKALLRAEAALARDW